VKRRSLTVTAAGLLAVVAVPASPAAADVRLPVPDGVVASAGDESATVRWKSFQTGRGGLTQYTITASPGGASTTTTEASGTVTGLTNGTEYTFRVTTSGFAGTSDPSAPSNPVVPAPAE
jgi:large repetitive protein